MPSHGTAPATNLTDGSEALGQGKGFSYFLSALLTCACVFVRACVHVCVRAYVRVCICACVHARVYLYLCYIMTHPALA